LYKTQVLLKKKAEERETKLSRLRFDVSVTVQDRLKAEQQLSRRVFAENARIKELEQMLENANLNNNCLREQVATNIRTFSALEKGVSGRHVSEAVARRESRRLITSLESALSEEKRKKESMKKVVLSLWQKIKELEANGTLEFRAALADRDQKVEDLKKQWIDETEDLKQKLDSVTQTLLEEECAWKKSEALRRLLEPPPQSQSRIKRREPTISAQL
jgi:hypothetical protein